MRAQNALLLSFFSNIEQYELTVYDGERVFRKRVDGGNGRLCLCPCSPCLRVIATPRQSGYTATLYFWVDARCQREVKLYFAFPQTTPPPTPPVAVNTFTLTDRNYGLPIDGALLFTQTS